MPALQVKDFPDDIYEQLRVVAAEENRSISQQTLVIIKEFLWRRNHGEFAAETRRQARSAHSYVNTERTDGVDYLAKRLATMERIKKLPPLPIGKGSPSAEELVRQLRDEEAR